LKVALLAPIAWRTPPRHYGPWENIVSLLAEGLVKEGVEVSLFATGDSLTGGKLRAICPHPYEENRDLDPKVWEYLHISHLFEQAHEFDIIHNHFDFMPLAFSRLVATPMVTTIHGFSSPRILPVYQHYNSKNNYYVSISDADRSPLLRYTATIYHGINLQEFTFQPQQGSYLLYFGRIHPDKGTYEAIQIAAGKHETADSRIIQDMDYYQALIAPCIDNKTVHFLGAADRPPETNCWRAYALLHPIRFAEPFGLSVVEAMACGTPVIAFNRGSMPEVVDDGKSGFWLMTWMKRLHAGVIYPTLDARTAVIGWKIISVGREW
jgi:glycosyltransferase involved in cell wall biosynthesis